MTVASDSRSRERRTREDVVRTAGRLFAERGYHGTSMRDLGEAVGLLGSSLYAHVDGKENLLVEVIGRSAARFDALAAQVRAWEGTPAEQLRRFVDGHVGIVTETPDEARVFLDEVRFLSGDARRQVLAMRDRYEARYREVLAGGVASGDWRADLDVAFAALLILSLLNSIPRWYRPDGPKSPTRVAEDLFSFVLEAIT